MLYCIAMHYFVLSCTVLSIHYYLTTVYCNVHKYISIVNFHYAARFDLFILYKLFPYLSLNISVVIYT